MGTDENADVVRRGGIAPSDADTEDVTRDTYGWTSPETTDQRGEADQASIDEANRAAEESGIPGVRLPDESQQRGAPPAGRQPGESRQEKPDTKQDKTSGDNR